jgi:C2 domain in Dock180 and Zizimin proteins
VARPLFFLFAERVEAATMPPRPKKGGRHRQVHAGTVRVTSSSTKKLPKDQRPSILDLHSLGDDDGDVSRPVLVTASSAIPSLKVSGTESSKDLASGASDKGISSPNGLPLPERRSKNRGKKNEKKAAVMVAKHTSVVPMKFDFEERCKAAYEDSDDPHRDVLLTFPPDDLSVVQKPNVLLSMARSRQSSRDALSAVTGRSSAKGETKARAPKFVVDALRYFNAENTRTERAHRLFERESSSTLDDIPPLEFDFENSLVDTSRRISELTERLRHEEEVGTQQLHFEYLQRYSEETADVLASERSKKRSGMFHASDPTFEHASAEVQDCGRNVDALPFPKRPVFLSFTPVALSFMLGELEPFFCSAFLFSLKTGKRVSETFSFDLQGEVLVEQLQLDSKRLSKRVNRCLFTVTEPHDQLFLVVKVQKCLNGSIEGGTEPYTSSRLDPVELNRLKEQVEIERKQMPSTYPYRQPLAWLAFPLFDRRGHLAADANSANWKSRPLKGSLGGFEIELSQIIRASSHGTEDEVIMQQLAERRENPGAFDKRVKTCAAIFTFELAQVKKHRDLDFLVLTPMLDEAKSAQKDRQKGSKKRPEKSSKNDKSSARKAKQKKGKQPAPDHVLEALKSGSVVREMRELHEVEPLATHVEISNDLFIYPRKFAPASGQRKWKHISVRVEFRRGDEIPHRIGEKVIFPMDSTPFLCREASCALMPGQRQGQFEDEIKVKLPTVLERDFHLFFTFFHVNLKKATTSAAQGKTLSQADMELPIGHAVLRVDPFHELQTEEQELAVFTNQLDESTSPSQWIRYLPAAHPKASKDQRRSLSWLDSGKGIFSVRIRLRSSLYPHSAPVARFFTFYRAVGRKIEDEMTAAVLGLVRAPIAAIVQHLPVVMHGLMSSLSAHSRGQLGTAVIRVLVVILGRLRAVYGGERISLLTHYIWNTLGIVQEGNDGEWLFESLLKNYLMFLGEKQAAARTYAALLERSPHSLPTDVHGQPEVDVDRLDSLNEEQEYEANSDPSSLLNRTITPMDLRVSWVVFDSISRSMQLKILQSDGDNKPQYGNARETLFEQSLVYIIRKLVSLILATFREVADAPVGTLPSGAFDACRSANRHLALFLCDLFAVMDRGQVLELLSLYLSEVMSAASAQMLPVGGSNARKSYDLSSPIATRLNLLKVDFFRVIVDYEHFIPLNLPVRGPSLRTMSMSSPVGLFHKMVQRALTVKVSRSIREQTVGILRQLLCKHEWDARYQEPGCQARIAAMHFPLVVSLVRSWRDFTLAGWLKEASVDEKRGLYACVVYVFKFLEHSQLKDWLRARDTKQMHWLSLFDMIQDIVDVFQWHSVKAPPKKESKKTPVPGVERREAKTGALSIQPSQALLQAAAAAGAAQRSAASRAVAIPIGQAQAAAKERRKSMEIPEGVKLDLEKEALKLDVVQAAPKPRASRSSRTGTIRMSRGRKAGYTLETHSKDDGKKSEKTVPETVVLSRTSHEATCVALDVLSFLGDEFTPECLQEAPIDGSNTLYERLIGQYNSPTFLWF